MQRFLCAIPRGIFARVPVFVAAGPRKETSALYGTKRLDEAYFTQQTGDLTLGIALRATQHRLAKSIESHSDLLGESRKLVPREYYGPASGTLRTIR
jgi:hypothetical protein